MSTRGFWRKQDDCQFTYSVNVILFSLPSKNPRSITYITHMHKHTHTHTHTHTYTYTREELCSICLKREGNNGLLASLASVISQISRYILTQSPMYFHGNKTLWGLRLH
jgi:hypothetical protein